MKFPPVLIALGGALVLACPARASVNAADRAFAQDFSVVLQSEIAASKLAEDNALSQKVKHMGHDVGTSDEALQVQLKALAKAKGITLPTALSASYAASLKALTAETGLSFDTTYLDDMVKAHTAANSLIATETKSGSDAKTKAFAAQAGATYKAQLDSLATLRAAMAP